ncbi:MAG: Esterase/lipase [Myxococcaceae bacterium]|nr:Esterase/lipase [Myxococcaceae bacterium]
MTLPALKPSSARDRLTFRQRLRLRRAELKSAAIDGFVHVFARLRYAMPDAHPRRFDVTVTKNVVYGATNGRAHRLDVYMPSRAKTEGPLPVVMYVHGGGFSMLSKDTHYVMAMQFARRGYVVFNINYRMGQKNVFPAPLEDACEALVWVHQHCKEYGGDPSRIALAGESAGGNLVAALAIANAVRRPEPFARRVYDANIPIRATVCTYPFGDVTDLARYLEHPKLGFLLKGMLFDAASAYVGHGVYDLAAISPLASPVLLLEHDLVTTRPLSPFFLSVGTRDPLLRHSRRMKQALDRLGVEAELFIAPGEIHGFDAMVWRPAARKKWKAAATFLARHMALEPTRLMSFA